MFLKQIIVFVLIRQMQCLSTFCAKDFFKAIYTNHFAMTDTNHSYSVVHIVRDKQLFQWRLNSAVEEIDSKYKEFKSRIYIPYLSYECPTNGTDCQELRKLSQMSITFTEVRVNEIKYKFAKCDDKGKEREVSSELPYGMAPEGRADLSNHIWNIDWLQRSKPLAAFDVKTNQLVFLFNSKTSLDNAKVMTKSFFNNSNDTKELNFRITFEHMIAIKGDTQGVKDEARVLAIRSDKRVYEYMENSLKETDINMISLLGCPQKANKYLPFLIVGALVVVVLIVLIIIAIIIFCLKNKVQSNQTTTTTHSTSRTYSMGSIVSDSIRTKRSSSKSVPQ